MTCYTGKHIVWDLKNIDELRAHLANLGEDEDAIDMSALPSAPIPDDVDTSYPVWAMDEAGNMLVGDAADQVMTLDDYRSLRDA